MKPQKVILGYWNTRGAAEPIRTLLEYLGIPYAQEKYTYNEEWLEKKPNVKFQFPNLPYLIDGNKTLTETHAIHAYLCIKANKPEMIGKGEDIVEFTQLKGVYSDLHKGLVSPIHTSKSFDELRSSIDKYMQSHGKYKLSGFNQILGNREWILGYLTHLDFQLTELFERFKQLDEEVGTRVMVDFRNLQVHPQKLYELPNIKAYRQSERFRARPYHRPASLWN